MTARVPLRLTVDELWLMSAVRDELLLAEVETWRWQAPAIHRPDVEELVRSLLVRDVLIAGSDVGFGVAPWVTEILPLQRDCTWQVTLATLLPTGVINRLSVVGNATRAALLRPVAGGVEILSSGDPAEDLARALASAAVSAWGQREALPFVSGVVDVERAVAEGLVLRAQQVLVGRPRAAQVAVAGWLEAPGGCQALLAAEGEWFAGDVGLEGVVATCRAVAANIEALAAAAAFSPTEDPGFAES